MNDTWSDGPDPVGGDAFDDGAPLDDTGYDDTAGYDDALGDDDTDTTELDDTGDDEPADIDGQDDTDDPALSDEDGSGDDGDDGLDTDLALDDSPDDTGDADEVAVFETVDDEVVGADPDVPAGTDDDAFTPDFPPELDVDELPEPVDGPPWTDAELLGDVADHTDTSWNTIDSSTGMSDLFTMDGTSGGDWQSLLNSDDPAVSSLARWWQP